MLWHFLVWGTDIMGVVPPKALSGNRYILVAIDYSTKWVKFVLYTKFEAKDMAKFIKYNIICRYIGCFMRPYPIMEPTSK